MFFPHRSPVTHCTPRSGFSLVEILVVLGVIAVLSALLLGALAGVREKGRQATCQSNLRQIQQAVLMYVQDNSGRYPSYYNGFQLYYGGFQLNYPNVAPGIGWAVRIRAYLKTNAVLQCPNEATPASNDPLQPIPFHSIGGYSDYGYNYALTNVAESRLVSPNRSVTFTDIITQPAWAIASDPAGPLDDFTRHSGGGNCAFADGHVKWFLPSQIYYTGLALEGDSGCKTHPSSPATFCLY